MSNSDSLNSLHCMTIAAYHYFQQIQSIKYRNMNACVCVFVCSIAFTTHQIGCRRYSVAGVGKYISACRCNFFHLCKQCRKCYSKFSKKGENSIRYLSIFVDRLQTVYASMSMCCAMRFIYVVYTVYTVYSIVLCTLQ